MQLKKIIFFLVFLFNFFSKVNSLNQFDYIFYSDFNLKSQFSKNKRIFFDSSFFLNFDFKSFDEEGNVGNIFQAYDSSQNFLGLFQGPGIDLKDINLINGLIGPGTNNLNVNLSGKIISSNIKFDLNFKIKKDFYLGFYVILYFQSLSNFKINFNPANKYFSEILVRNQILNNVLNNSEELFDLSFKDWTRSGFGDLNLVLNWKKLYPQNRPLLKEVMPFFKLAITLPTGELEDYNKILAKSFGTDGSISFNFGGGLNLFLGKHFNYGFSGDFWYILGNEKLRRIKTFVSQTEYFLPIVESSFKSYGLMQKFNLFCEFTNIDKYLSLLFKYLYFKKGEDTVSSSSNLYNYSIINSQKSLDQATAHYISICLNYNSNSKKENKKLNPNIGIGFNFPIYGSYSILPKLFSFNFNFEF